MDLYAPYLDHAKASEPTANNVVQLRPRPQKRRIARMGTAYILEDDEASGIIATEFLKGYGFKTVIWRRSMVQAKQDIAQIANGDMDLVLLDVMLPDGTSVSFLEQVIEQGCPCPVGLYTGRAALEDAGFYTRHQCDFVFPKPLMADQFVDTLDSLKRA